MTERIYTGIGSRETPTEVLNLMFDMAVKLASHGWVVRTGGAPGADDAFAKGARLWDGANSTEIYLPWEGFNGWNRWDVALKEPTSQALDLAAEFHPAWGNVKHGGRKLHGRNMHQILGQDVLNPILPVFVVCWTQGGQLKGGTAQALRVAKHFNVPILNLGKPGMLELFKALV
jgi:hypothetical protein